MADRLARSDLDAEAQRLQSLMWSEATAASEADPRSVPAGLFVQAMNELIDSKGASDAALANRVPGIVLILLVGFAVLAVGMVGYGNGLAETRSPGATVILAFLITLVILVIIDLDRPRRGLIRMNLDGLTRLRQELVDAG